MFAFPFPRPSVIFFVEKKTNNSFDCSNFFHLLLNNLDPQEKAMLVARKSFLNIMNLIKVQEQSPIIPSYYPEEGDDASTCPLPPSPKRRRRQ